VVGLHVGFIWALQSGLLMRAAEIVVPAEVLAQFIDPPAPKVEPVPPTPPTPTVQKKAVAKGACATGAAAPGHHRSNALTERPDWRGHAAASAAPVAVAPVAPPAPAAVQLPSSDADYLQNPKPPYPPISKRLGEQGKVTLRVLIGIDGQAKKVEIRQSSGFDRLDQAATTTVMRWRYVPGKRGGVPEEMWSNVPINFVLE
jgi:protein TonB